jgi:hypothetical protein
MAAKTRSKALRPAAFLRVAYSAPAPEAAACTDIRRFTLLATKALPFVKLRPNDQPMLRPESYWHVRSTGKRKLDLQLGRQYARAAIAAMKADRNSNLLALILQDIVRDAVHRAARHGGSPQSPTVLGFLAELSGALAANSE